MTFEIKGKATELDKGKADELVKDTAYLKEQVVADLAKKPAFATEDPGKMQSSFTMVSASASIQGGGTKDGGSGSSSTVPIIAGAMGGVVLLVAVATIFVVTNRRKQFQMKTDSTATEMA